MKRGLLAAAVLCLPTAMFATHFRGGVMIPSVDATGLLTITSTTFWRPGPLTSSFPVAAIDEIGNPTVNGMSSTDVGSDPNVGSFAFRTFDTADIRYTEVTSQHTFRLPGAGAYDIRMADSCCRISTLFNGRDNPYTLTSRLVWDGRSANLPINFTFAGLQYEVEQGLEYRDNLGAVSTQALTYSTFLNTGINFQPTGYGIESDGDIVISAANTALLMNGSDGDYAYSGRITAADGSYVTFDWIYDVVPGGTIVNRPPSVDDAEYKVLRGTTLDHTMTGSDPNGDDLTWSLLSFLGPGGAMPAVAPTFNPLTQLFSWDTTGSDLGLWVAQIRASDGSLTDSGTIRIDVFERVVTGVPEPSSMFLAAGALGLLVAARRRRLV